MCGFESGVNARIFSFRIEPSIVSASQAFVGPCLSRRGLFGQRMALALEFLSVV